MTCAAGGSLKFDNFAGDELDARQTMTPSLLQLTRAFTYTSTVTSQFSADVLTQCGETLEMNVSCRVWGCRVLHKGA